MGYSLMYPGIRHSFCRARVRDRPTQQNMWAAIFCREGPPKMTIFLQVGARYRISPDGVVLGDEQVKYWVSYSWTWWFFQINLATLMVPPLAAILHTLTLCCMLYRSAKKSRKKKSYPTCKVYLRYVQYFICMMAGVMAAGLFFCEGGYMFRHRGSFCGISSHPLRVCKKLKVC